MFNAILLAEGYAQLLTIPPNVPVRGGVQGSAGRSATAGQGFVGWSASRNGVSTRPVRSQLPGGLHPTPSTRPGLQGHTLPAVPRAATDPHHFDGDSDEAGCEGAG